MIPTRSQIFWQFIPFGSVLLFCLAHVGELRAIERDFGIITNQSSIALSGTVTTALGTAPIQAQGPGSLTTTYSGTIKTDREPGTLAFLTGSTIDANVNGSWKPLSDGSDGSAPADYGAKATYLFVLTTNFAGRDLVAGLTSGAIPIDATGHVDLSTTTVQFVSGNLAYRGPGGDPVGTASIAGAESLLSGSGSLTYVTQASQVTETLTLPVSATFVLQPDTSTTVNLTLTGQLVGTATYTPLLGDYNDNGIVDAADYVLWRGRFWRAGSPPDEHKPGGGG